MEETESSCAFSEAAARGTAWVESLMCIDTSLSVIFFKKQSPAFIVKLQFNETQVSEAKRAETCWMNYPTCEAKWGYIRDPSFRNKVR
jgi:hypothetical protein